MLMYFTDLKGIMTAIKLRLYKGKSIMQTALIIFFMVVSLFLAIMYARLSMTLDKMEKKLEELEETIKGPSKGKGGRKASIPAPANKK